MPEIRKFAVIFALMTTAAPGALAQLAGVGAVPLTNGFTTAPYVPTQPLNCSVAAIPNTVRVEGFSELLGDLVLTCTGALQLNQRNWRVGIDVAPAAGLPQLVNMSVTLAAPITSRIVGGSNMTEALLFLSDVSEFTSWIATGGTSQANLNPCSAANTGANGACSNLANLDGLNNSAPTVGNSRPTAVGINLGTADSSASVPINVIQGQLQTANSITFFGVPISQVDSSQNANIANALNLMLLALSPNQVVDNTLYTGQPIIVPFTKKFRMKNFRGAISGFGRVDGSVSASLSIQNPPANLILNSSTGPLGYLQQGLLFDRRSATNSGQSFGLTYAQCEDSNRSLATDATSSQFGSTVQPGQLLRYTEGYANAFKMRGYLPGQLAMQDQNDPTRNYSTESGYYNTVWSGLPNGLGRAGIADHGTRLRAQFNAVPANLRLYVTVGNLNGSPDQPMGAYGVMTDGSGANQGSSLVRSMATSGAFSDAANPTFATFGNVLSPFAPSLFTGPAGAPFQGASSTNGFVEVPVNVGTGAFTWEVYSSVPYQPETALFQVIAAWRVAPSAGLGTMTVQGSFAPVNTTAAASDSGVPIPRFQDGSSPLSFLSLVSCASTLLHVSQVAREEGNSGTNSYNFVAFMSSPAPVGGVSFDISTVDGTALAGSDYVARSLIGQSIPEGSSTFSFTVLVNGDTTVEPTEYFYVYVNNVKRAVPGDLGVGAIYDDDVTLTPISAIQGTGTTSPLVGQQLTTSGIVTALTPTGYYLQTPDALVDADPRTSEGLEIMTNGPSGVRVGAPVQATGTVTELGTGPVTTTVLLSSSTTGTLRGSLIPTPVPVLAASLTAAGGLNQLERYEGMRVSIAALNVVAPTGGNLSEANATSTSNGLFYGTFPGVAAPVREAGIDASLPVPPCAAGAGCAIPLFDANPERIAVSTGAVTGQVALDVGTGATVANVVGVLDQSGTAYRVKTTQAPVVGGSAVLSAALPAAPVGALSVAALNAGRLFDTMDDPATADTVLTATAFNSRLAKLSNAIRNRLRSPDVVALAEVENLATAQTLASRVNADATGAGDPNPGYVAYLTEGNDAAGLDVAVLVRSGAVTVDSLTQLEKTTSFTNPCDGTQALVNERPPLRLRGTATKGGQLLAFTLFVNHLSSSDGSGDATACTLATEGARVRARRAAQANNVAKIVQDELTANPDARILVAGDFNAIEANDGYVDTLGTILGTPAPGTQVATLTLDPTYPNLQSLATVVPQAQRYASLVEGNRQTAESTLLNPAALGQLLGGGYVRVNADFPDVLRNDVTRPERYAGHDPVVTYVTTATNLAGQTSLTGAGLVYNRAALTATSRVTVRNTTTSTIPGPLNLVITGLPDGVTLTNGNALAGGGVSYALPSPLAAGQSVVVNLNFALDAIKAIAFKTALYAGIL